MTTSKRIALHVVAPVALVLPLILGYFYGGPAVRGVITPAISRELGLLENLQVLVLVALLGVVGYGLTRTSDRSTRLVLGVLGLGTLLLTLEELDYGMHYYDALQRWRGDEPAEVSFRNIHNLGYSTRLKQLGDLVIVVFFVVAPWVCARSRRPLLRRFAPSGYFVASVVTMVLLSRFAHLLNDLSEESVHPLRHGISEFRELFIYYLVLLYAAELVLLRIPGARAAREACSRE